MPRFPCKNEGVILKTTLGATGHSVTLVPMAAIFVAFIDVLLSLRYRDPHVIPCAAQFRKGEEMGWFEHGSTIIMLVNEDLSICDNIKEGAIVRMGEPRAPRRG
jgi:phosphatidylserine decarboxylase